MLDGINETKPNYLYSKTSQVLCKDEAKQSKEKYNV
jgi:hypothetical protein